MPPPDNDKPKLGPFLRQYAELEQKTPRERTQEWLLGAAAGLGMLVVLVGVLLAFVRFPLPTLGALVLVWAVGFVVLLTKRRRSEARERALREDLDGREEP